MCGGLKVAIVWNHPTRLLDCSFRFAQYVAGFENLGHQPVVVCRHQDAEGFQAGPVYTVNSTVQLEEPATWCRIGATAALIVTWHRMTGVLSAMREAGTRVIAYADTDGRIGFRSHPWSRFEILWLRATSWLERVRCLRYCASRVLRERLGTSPEDAEILHSTRLSDAVVFGSSRAREEFGRLLQMHYASDLGERLAVVPFTIGPQFLAGPVPEQRSAQIVAVGRWDDPQKNTPLLAATLELFLAARDDVAVEIFGWGGERWLAPLAKRWAGVTCRGMSSHEDMVETMSRARSILFTSRWEGSPHAALEALAVGATVVGTSIPSLASWTEGGRYGRVAAPRPRALAAALTEEMADWESGRRDPRAIAQHWRDRLMPDRVCRALLAAVELDSPRPGSAGVAQ